LDQKQPPAIEEGPHTHRGADRHNAIHERICGDEGHQGDDGRAGPQQREQTKDNRGEASQQEQPPVVADGGRNLIG